MSTVVQKPTPAERLALLRRLTGADPGWLAWKNCDTAVAGEGDIDSAAPTNAWPAIEAEFVAWAAEAGLGPTITCRHAPGLLVVVACAGSDPVRLFQLDVYEQPTLVSSAQALLAVAEVDEQGFRRLRPGAEGLLRIVATLRRPVRPPRDDPVLDAARALVRADPEGARRLAAALGRPGRPALAVARAVAAGAWDSRAAMSMEFGLIAQGARHPGRRAAWLRFKLGAGARCPVLSALAAGRIVPGDREAWLLDVAREHEIRRSEARTAARQSAEISQRTR